MPLLVLTPRCLASDSTTTTHNSLTPGLGLMPSHDEESVDGLESLLDLEPPQRPPDQDDGIRFRTRHFNDSSEEEDSLSRGLQFSDAAPEAPRPEPVTMAGPFAELMARAALENMAKTLVDAVSSVAQSVVTREAATAAAAAPRPLADDDSDEDFEMINEDELPSVS